MTIQFYVHYILQYCNSLSLHPLINIYLAPLCSRYCPRCPVGRRTSPNLSGAFALVLRSGLWSREAWWGPEGWEFIPRSLWPFWMCSLPSTLPGDMAGLAPITVHREEGHKCAGYKEALGLLSSEGGSLSPALSAPKDQTPPLASPLSPPQESSVSPL